MCRAKTIPFVCREFRAIHKLHPPSCWHFGIERPVSESLLNYFLWVAPSVQEIAVNPGTNPPCWNWLPELLTAAADKSPHLQDVYAVLPADHDSIVRSLAALSQIKSLNLSDWRAPTDSDVNTMQLFTGLLSLEVDYHFSTVTYSTFIMPNQAIWKRLLSQSISFWKMRRDLVF